MPVFIGVGDVSGSRHRKDGSPDSLRVSYRCGISVVHEWVCLDHPGEAGVYAHRWWLRRFGSESSAHVSVSSALQDLFLPSSLKQITKSITVVRDGKYNRSIGYDLKS